MKKKMLLMSILSMAMLFSCGSLTSSTEVQTEKEVVTIYNDTTTQLYSSTADMVAAVKSSVVDVYAYNASGYSAGSGVIAGKDENGYYIITNHHVIEDCYTFDVVTYADDSKTYEAEFIGGSKSNDIAALYIRTTDAMNAATFGDSDKLRVGQDVVAIGNPLGILGGTVTKGIISALERETYIDDIGYMKLLQTDAAINSGNSGGALFDDNGELIGIVNSGYSSYEGLNFAIPSNAAKTSFTSLINTRTADHYGYVEGDSNLGITLDEGTVYSDSSCTDMVTAVYVASVSSADCDGYVNGLKDYYNFYYGNYTTFYAITKIGDEEVTGTEQALKLLSQYKAGETLSLTYKEINYKRAGGPGGFGGQAIYYLGEENTLSFALSQYIYTLPTA